LIITAALRVFELGWEQLAAGIPSGGHASPAKNLLRQLTVEADRLREPPKFASFLLLAE
jgi:hypothetical protein